jgi:hypothetical protein
MINGDDIMNQKEVIVEQTTREAWRRWRHKTRKDLKEIGWEVVDLMHVVLDRDQWRALVNTVTKLRVS